MATAGRPRKFDEDAVLDAAMTVFWQHGYDAATLAQLREATGLSSASLYGAFGSKSELFERAVEHYVKGPGRVTDLVTDPDLSAAEALRRMLYASIAMQSDPAHPLGCLVALSATVGADTDEGAAARTAAARRRQADRDRITDCVRRGQSSGELTGDLDADAIATLVHTFLLGISTQVRDGVPPERLRSAADACLAPLRVRT
ncbi:TetR/AcrR family transcriptional regulator [Pseudonocardia zijingensis]|uniref:TetR/AcrR family transcriptional regulator n=1 Tax=Pseudonocardia zijingensis TaxID=153376 RepID=A0ABN1PXI4_9PSEU